MIDSAILIDFNAGSPESEEHAECIDAYEKHRATIVFLAVHLKAA